MVISLSEQKAVRDLERLASLHKTLGDPVRLRIVNMLLEQPTCVKALCEVLNMSQPRISRHMAVLRGAGIIFTRREGKFIFYNLEYTRECDGIFSCVLNARENFSLFREDIRKLKRVQKEVC